jgi:hypothetical protein
VCIAASRAARADITFSMTSDSNSAHSWHAERRKRILLVHPEINDLIAPDANGTLVFFAYPLVHLVTAILCGLLELSLVRIFFLSATVGAYCVFGCFNNGHEFCHELVLDKFRDFKSLLLHFQFLGDVNPMQWMYFRHGHISHHIHSGEQSQTRAWRLDLAQDADMLSHLSYIYAMRRTNGAQRTQDKAATQATVKAEHRVAFAHHAVSRFILIGVLAPLLDTALVLTLAVPVGLYHLIVRMASPLARRKLLGYLLHCALMYALLFALATYIDVRSVVYLFASRLFFCGWLGHPVRRESDGDDDDDDAHAQDRVFVVISILVHSASITS